MLDTLYDGAVPADSRARRALDVVFGVSRSRSGCVFRFHSGYRDESFAVFDVALVDTIGPEARFGNESIKVALEYPDAYRLYGKTLAGTVSSVMSPHSPAAFAGWSICWSKSIVDAIGIVSRDAHGSGIGLCVGLEATLSLSAHESRLLTRIATHVGAADRLPAKRSIDAADAVLSPNGKLLHAAEPARIPEVLDGVARRSFARKSRHDAEQALDAWQGLVDGSWSIVDHFDTDGKRFVLAMKNVPEVAPRAQLAPHDRRVAALAAMGHRDKEIAYSLGITMGSVAAALRRARKALRVTTRAELAARWRGAKDVDAV